MENVRFCSRFWTAFKAAMKPALYSIRFLLAIMLPVSLVVMLLDHSGLLFYAAKGMNPFMKVFGLPGEAALVIISAFFLNNYSAIAVIQSLALSGRQIAVLATMCLIAHNIIVESAVMHRTGSNTIKMVLLRAFFSFAAGFLLNLILPETIGKSSVGFALVEHASIGIALDQIIPIFTIWITQSFWLVLKISLIVFALIILQKEFDEFGITKFLGKITAPLMRVFGLPSETGYLWIVANTAGLTYGSAIMADEVKNGHLSSQHSNMLNHHSAMSHSQLEDTLLFTAIGVPYLWAALPRLVLAIMLVWLEKARRILFRRSFRVEIG
jgi:spore maturation protein SpmB